MNAIRQNFSCTVEVRETSSLLCVCEDIIFSYSKSSDDTTLSFAGLQYCSQFGDRSCQMTFADTFGAILIFIDTAGLWRFSCWLKASGFLQKMKCTQSCIGRFDHFSFANNIGLAA